MLKKRNREEKVALLAEDPLPDQEVRAGEGVSAAEVVWAGVTFVEGVGAEDLRVWGVVWTEVVCQAQGADRVVLKLIIKNMKKYDYFRKYAILSLVRMFLITS